MKEIPALSNFIRKAVKFFYRKITVEGIENLPDEPVILVGNHSQAHGAIISQLYHPRKCYTWTIAEMMHIKEVPAYAYGDFWSKKPVYIRWLFKLISYIIAPVAAYVMTYGETIGVYKDARVINTIKETCDTLSEGADVIIFPECYEEHNNIVHEFQEGFVDVARFYYKKTKKNLPFVPMYLCPELKKVIIGKPIYYNAEGDKKAEPARICTYLMDEISEMAYNLPPHTVVPYPNIPKKYYPTNERPRT